MSVQLTVLGSGSAGNATLLQHGEGRVLIDAGLSCRELTKRLERVGVEPSGVGAMAITHVHGDHTKGAALFSRRYDVPVYVTDATREVWGQGDVASWQRLTCDTVTEICGFRFLPFEVLHDADAETVGFRIDTSAGAIGFATDIGMVTPQLRNRFQSCRLLVIESNHAVELLAVGPYAESTKVRIGSNRGHLSNEALATFIREDLGPSVECLVLAHLSRVNNVPELAEMTCREALEAVGRSEVRVVITRQDRVAETVELPVLTACRHPKGDASKQVTLPF